MPVFAEPRISIAPPSLMAIYESLYYGKLDDHLISAMNASDALLEVAADLNILVSSWTVSQKKKDDERTWLDALDLARLLKYYVYIVFDITFNAVFDAVFDAMLDPKDLKESKDMKEYYQNRAQGILHNAVVVEAYLREMNIEKLLGHEDYTKEINAWKEGNPNEKYGISLLGVVELLCRIAMHDCADIKQVINRLSNLQLATLERTEEDQWRLSNTGIPSTVFVCGKNVGQSTMFVATTSQDNWAGFGAIMDWWTEVRQHFRPSHAFVADAVKFDVVTCSAILKKEFDALDLREKTKPAVGAMRAKLSERMESKGATVNPGADIAIPLRCPKFEPKARCFRCRTLFQYHVPPEVIALENTNITYKNLKAYDGWTCAETIALAYCKRAWPQN